MKTQIGQLVGANLHEGTLEIEVGEDIIAKAGKYAVVPIEEYERLVKFSLDGVIESFNHEKMETIVPHYIVDMGKIPCNELRFIVETFLAQNAEYKKEVERLNSL